MKIYLHKLYGIPDAAKRSGVAEEDIKTMITDKFISTEETFFTTFIRGNIVVTLKRKWKQYQEKLKKNNGIKVKP